MHIESSQAWSGLAWPGLAGLAGRMDDMNAWEQCQSRNHRNNSLQLQPLAAAATRSQAEITNTRYLILPKGEPIIRLRLRLRPLRRLLLRIGSVSESAYTL